MTDLEFYETPGAFTRYLFREVVIRGTVFEPCVGAGAILRAAAPLATVGRWITCDLDQRWPADYTDDAAGPSLWFHVGGVDWTVTNPPFTSAIDIVTQATNFSRVGVAMHLRASIHEVLKTGVRRTWMAEHTPSGILWLPRFAYQRSKKTGKWTTDSVGACWVIWLKDPAARQFIRYAPGWVIDQLAAETPAYRQRMDALMCGRQPWERPGDAS